MLNTFNFLTLINNIPEDHKRKKINLVLEGGCMNGAYEIGGLTFIKQLEKKNKIRVKKISGASVGAYAGFLYLTDNLGHFVNDYEDLKSSFKKKLKLIKLKKQITFLVNKLTDNEFKSLQNNKLFITFYNVNKRQQEVISKYVNKKHLIKSILKSCHIPFLINGDCFYYDDDEPYIDGGTPYLFSINDKSKSVKNLYMKITRYDKLSTVLNISYEKTIHGRILEGILDTYNFFLKSKETKMCSFVEDWNIINSVHYNICKTSFHILIILIYLFDFFTKPFLLSFKKTHFYKHFSPAFFKIYESTIFYFVFM